MAHLQSFQWAPPVATFFRPLWLLSIKWGHREASTCSWECWPVELSKRNTLPQEYSNTWTLCLAERHSGDQHWRRPDLAGHAEDAVLLMRCMTFSLLGHAYKCQVDIFLIDWTWGRYGDWNQFSHSGSFFKAYQSFQFGNGPSGLCHSQEPLRALTFCRASKHEIVLWEGCIGMDSSRRWLQMQLRLRFWLLLL